MAILVTGSTGTIGSQVLNKLQGFGVEVRALTRSPSKAQLPPGVVPVPGDLAGISTLFLLVPNVADELTQAMLALTVARESRVKGLVYLSVLEADSYVDVPHFAGKYTVERMIEALDMPATVLRPAYFIQNDLRQKSAILDAGVYGMPIGSRGVSMVDIRDIGEAAALELLRRERASGALGREYYALVGPDVLTGERIAALWSEASGGGDDLAALEARMKTMMPAWHALDLRLMLGRYQSNGAVGTADDIARLTALLGHAPRSYREFTRDAVAQWRSA
jgi:uncharacterized protein YbjT (DUF2867 family)